MSQYVNLGKRSTNLTCNHWGRTPRASGKICTMNMRLSVLVMVISSLLIGCGGNEAGSATVSSPKTTGIPLPNNNSTVDPNVSALFQKTVSELRADMANPKLWVVHGSALFANGYYAESADALGRAIAINPEMPQATYLMATALWRANKQEEAIATLTLALELMPQYDMGWRLLAEWHLNRGKTTLAEQAARKAFELQPRRIGTRYVLCQALMDDGKYDDAVVLLEQVIAVDKAPPWIYQLAANCYRQLGDNDTYEVALAKAGPPFEDWPDPMFKHIPTLIAGKSELTEYALHLFKTAGSEKAMPFLLRAFKINPESTDLRVAFSIALQDGGQLQQSRQILGELTGEPNMNYWKQYAGVCIATGELDKAKEYVGNAFALDLVDPNAHDIAAVIALEQGETQTAVSHWAQAGKLYNEVEKWNKAEMSLAYAVQNGASGSEVLQSLALAQIKLNHTLQAKISIKKLLEKNPSDTVALELQSMLPQE
jgi:tetratricopeptide (TPR) repeat protein